MKAGDKVLFMGRILTLKEQDPRFLSWSFEELDISPVEYSRHPEPVKAHLVKTPQGPMWYTSDDVAQRADELGPDPANFSGNDLM